MEQCKYKLKERKRSRYIDHLKIIGYDSDSENDNENKIKIKSKDENFSVFVNYEKL